MTTVNDLFFFSSRRRHTRWTGDWSSDVCSSDLIPRELLYIADELFMTGTAAEITPIRSVDRLAVGNGKRGPITEDRKSTRLNSSHPSISYAVFCLKKKK